MEFKCYEIILYWSIVLEVAQVLAEVHRASQHADYSVPQVRSGVANSTDDIPDKSFWDNIFGKRNQTEQEGGKKQQSSACDARCGVPFESADRIMGGQPTSPNQFPWMVKLDITVPEFFNLKRISCTAVLIKRQYVLTAAHCVYYPKVTSIQALIGFHYTDVDTHGKTGNEVVLPATRIFIHEQFDPLSMQNDIAILELVKPVDFTNQVHTVCLPEAKTTDPPHDTNLTVAGWGVTEVFGTKFLPQMLLAATVPLVDAQRCRKAVFNMSKFVGRDSICAGGKTTDTCLGDSGGPLMLMGKNGTQTRYTVIGVTSWGFGCGSDGRPGIYARVASHVPWIERITARDPCNTQNPTWP